MGERISKSFGNKGLPAYFTNSLSYEERDRVRSFSVRRNLPSCINKMFG
jgi:hypothetical protein